jgi:hypothetical protein
MFKFLRSIPFRRRWYAVAVWMAVVALVFTTVGSWTERSWLLLFLAATIPPAMLLWFWNEDQPLVMERLQMRPRRRD